MTEAQIAARFGRRADQLEQLWLNGDITQEVYEAACGDLLIWARQQREICLQENNDCDITKDDHV